MSRKHYGREITDQYITNQKPQTVASSQLEIFQATFREFQQRIKKALGMCQPFSLVHKELEDILLMTQVKEADFKKMQQELIIGCEKQTCLKILPDSQSESNKSVSNFLDESLNEESSVQNLRKQGKELLDECKSALDEMKNKNQVLKSLYQPLQSNYVVQKSGSEFIKSQLTSPSSFQFSSSNPSSASNLVLSPTGINQASEKAKILLAPSSKTESLSYNEVLVNIEKFMQSLDQRAEGQSKRIENITQEIDALKEQIQPYKHLTQMKSISEKLEQQRDLLQEKSSKDNISKFLNISPKDYWTKEVKILRNTAQTQARPNDQPAETDGPKKTEKINDIHSTIDECSRFLARKRLDHQSPKNMEKPVQNSNSIASPPVRELQEKRPRNTSLGDSRGLLNRSDFDMHATMSRRESRLKSFFEREERMKKEPEMQGQNQTLPEKSSEELNMTQTLKRSDIDRKPLYEYYSSGKDQIVYCYENDLPGQGQKEEKVSQMNSPNKEEDLASTRKSCLVKRGGFSSKENSGAKAEKKLRFADEQQISGRALKFEEISDQPLNPLEQKDLNSQLSQKSNVKKAVLRGEISQLDREIKRISQLLNSVVLSETI